MPKMTSDNRVEWNKRQYARILESLKGEVNSALEAGGITKVVLEVDTDGVKIRGYKIGSETAYRTN